MSYLRDGSGDKFDDIGVAVVLAAVGMLLGFVALVFLVGIIDALTIAGYSVPEWALVAASVIALQGIGLVGTAVAYLRMTGRGLDFLRLSKPSPKQVALSFGTVVGMIAALIAVSVVIEALGQDPAGHGTVEQIADEDDPNPNLALYMVVLSILVIGPCEELLFRGVIQTKLRDSFSVEGAVGVASVIFALIHIPAYGADVIAEIVQEGVTVSSIQSLGVTLTVLFVLSLILGYVYERTDNLAVPMIAHGFYNAVLFGILYIGIEYADELEEMAYAFVSLV